MTYVTVFFPFSIGNLDVGHMTSKNPLDRGGSGADGGKSNDIKPKDESETIEKLLTSS